jgi:hypothetical protein
MAKMRTGRTTPLTTDPTTGARIANPEKMGAKEFGREGKTVFDVPGYEKAEGREISSWPVVREAFKSGKYGSRKLGVNEKGYKRDPRIMNYLSGKTDILSEDIDEPMIVRRTNNMTKEKEVLIEDRYTPGGPTYNKITKGSKIPKGQVVDMGTARWQDESKVVGATAYNKSWSSSLGSEAYGEDWTPSTKKPVSTPKPTAEPSIKKAAVTTPKPVVSTTPTTAPTTKSKSTVTATPKEDMTLSKMPIKKAGLIKTEKREIQGELEKRPEYTQISSTRKNILPTKGGRYNIHTPIGAKVVQALTGYNKKGGYQEGEGRIFGDRIRTTDKDRSYNTMQTDESGRAIFKGAEGLKDLRAQKKYNKEFDKYQAKQDQMKAYSSMFNNAANRNTIDSQISKLKKP